MNAEQGPITRAETAEAKLAEMRENCERLTEVALSLAALFAAMAEELGE